MSIANEKKTERQERYRKLSCEKDHEKPRKAINNLNNILSKNDEIEINIQ